jgi:hypothetical protein
MPEKKGNIVLGIEYNEYSRAYVVYSMLYLFYINFSNSEGVSYEK